MAYKHIFKQIDLTHLPILGLIIGYVTYWVELLYFSKAAHTTYTAWIFWLCISIGIFYYRKTEWIEGTKEFFLAWKKQDIISKIFLLSMGVLLFAMFIVAFWAASYPPHLIQESDALNYHITLPRQHLLAGSFAHLPWSLADLYLLPVQFSLAPFWLATELPNKWPQLIFVILLIPIVFKLVALIKTDYILPGIIAVALIFGSHFVGIQLGTAMLDLVLLTILIAGIYHLIKGDYVFSAIELSFYIFSKSFIPIQITLLLSSLLILGFIFVKSLKFKALWANDLEFNVGSCKKLILSFLCASVIIGGPFIAKSMHYTATPLFPFKVGIFGVGKLSENDIQYSSLQHQTQKALATKDQYGSGRGIVDFIKHIWLIAVPEKGVNNRYDYPVGLPYLLCLMPFIYFFIKDISLRRFNILSWVVVILWGIWWLGSHQTRFLYVPLALVFILISTRKEIYSKWFLGLLCLSLLLTNISVIRSHRLTLGKTWESVLREKDKNLLNLESNASEKVVLNFEDAAYAPFLIDVKGTDSVFVLKH